MSDDEGRLHDSGELDVAVSFMLTLELVQQRLIGRLGETEEHSRPVRLDFNSETKLLAALKCPITSGESVSFHF